jgi:hypothetical protein
MVTKGKETSRCLKDLLAMIDEIIPEAYAEAPASINPNSILSD